MRKHQLQCDLVPWASYERLARVTLQGRMEGMSIEFKDHHWITVESKLGTARLCVREPNALEGARYVGTIGRYRALMETDEAGGFEGLIEAHAGMLVACIISSEDWTPAFPSADDHATKKAWVVRLHWEDIAKLASAVVQVGYPKTSAG